MTRPSLCAFPDATTKSRRPSCAAAGLLLLVAAGLGGCSAAIPLPALGSRDDVTGSIPITSKPLGASLDDEDWRRAHGALNVALDPQGNGTRVAWDNPATGAKGAIVPLGNPYPSDDRICRAFRADLGGSVSGPSVSGIGCRDARGDWAVEKVAKPT